MCVGLLLCTCTSGKYMYVVVVVTVSVYSVSHATLFIIIDRRYSTDDGFLLWTSGDGRSSAVFWS